MGIKEVFQKNLSLDVYEPAADLYFKSIILEAHDDHIFIGIPLRNQRQLRMERGSTWDFRFISKEAPYYFRSSCLGTSTSGQVSCYMIGRPQEVKKVQRREYYRFPCSFDTHYWLIKGLRGEAEGLIPSRMAAAAGKKGTGKVVPQEESISLEALAEQLGEPGKAINTNLSGGGLQLVAPACLPVDSVLLLAVFLRSRDKRKTLLIKGNVVWVGENEPQRTGHFRHAVKFIDLDERVRDEIVGFIFLLMRERML